VNSIQIVDGKYRIERLLGEGGMGAVYEARHLGTGRRVAVKVIAGDALGEVDDDAIERFQREARAAGAIESRHIAQVLDTGVDPRGDFPYIVMEYLQGEDLSKAMVRLAPFAPELALRIVSQACAGLKEAHLANVIHRDVKPANLYLVRQDGGDVIVKLLDFGIAKIRLDPMSSGERAVLTTTGITLGSPLYMSPEQARGAKDVDHRSDIWSLGIVLHECLSGATPYAECASYGELVLSICGEQRFVQDVAPWVSGEIAELVDTALAVDPARRFQSAGEMGAAIRKVLKSGHAIDESMLVPLAPDVRARMLPAPLAASSQVCPEAATAPVLETRTGPDDGAIPTPVPIVSRDPRKDSEARYPDVGVPGALKVRRVVVLSALLGVAAIAISTFATLSAKTTPRSYDSRPSSTSAPSAPGSSQALPPAESMTAKAPAIASSGVAPIAPGAAAATSHASPRPVLTRPASLEIAKPKETSASTNPCSLLATYDPKGNPHFTCPCSICQ
jgi:serine/threonine-protein kinase